MANTQNNYSKAEKAGMLFIAFGFLVEIIYHSVKNIF